MTFPDHTPSRSNLLGTLCALVLWAIAGLAWQNPAAYAASADAIVVPPDQVKVVSASSNMEGAEAAIDGDKGTIWTVEGPWPQELVIDIAGVGATLSAGYIGAPAAADQAMANLISIDGQRNPWPMGIPSSAYTFVGLEIGSAVPIAGGGGGGGNGGSATPPPIPGTNPSPVTPPGTEPGGWPVTPAPTTSFDVLPGDIARIQRSAELMVLSVKLPPEPQCDAASAYAACDALLQSR